MSITISTCVRLCMCVCICVFMCLCVCACARWCTRACMGVRRRSCADGHVQVWVWVCVHAGVRGQGCVRVRALVCGRTRAGVRACAGRHAPARVHVFMCARAHACVCICTIYVCVYKCIRICTYIGLMPSLTTQFLLSFIKIS